MAQQEDGGVRRGGRGGQLDDARGRPREQDGVDQLTTRPVLAAPRVPDVAALLTSPGKTAPQQPNWAAAPQGYTHPSQVL